MLKRIFGSSDGGSGGTVGGSAGASGKPNDTIAILSQLKETLSMLEMREEVLHKKANEEVQKAKSFTTSGNRKAALQCLKKKKLYETNADQVANNQLRVHDQIMLLEGATATTQTVEAMRAGANAMKQLQRKTNIDDVDRVMDDINETTDNMRQIQEALGQPLGPSAEFDDDELDKELQEMEAMELEKKLMDVGPTPAPVPVAPAKEQPIPMPAVPSTRPVAPARENIDAELADLEAELLVGG